MLLRCSLFFRWKLNKFLMRDLLIKLYMFIKWNLIGKSNYMSKYSFQSNTLKWSINSVEKQSNIDIKSIIVIELFSIRSIRNSIIDQLHTWFWNKISINGRPFKVKFRTGIGKGAVQPGIGCVTVECFYATYDWFG